MRARHVPTVVVGGGAAGCVVASRLTERADEPVLLIEAGPDHAGELPDDLRDGTRNSTRRHDWGLRHRPNRQQVELPLPRGRVVGGSSAVNTCIALRGCARDYDEWGELGLAGWSWSAVAPVFRRIERDLDFGDAPHHGDRGPLPIRRHPPEELAPWSAAFLQAAGDAGHAPCPDHNAPDAEGYGPHAMNKVNGRRISAAEAWLGPAVRARPNLTIQAHTHAVRVVLSGDRAVAVEVLHRGEPQRIEADRVVVCAGAVLTPGLLMRSGIGPRADLDRIGVPVARELPVARRLLDHPGAAFFCVARPSAWDSRVGLIQAALRVSRPDGRWPGEWLIQPGNFLALGGVATGVGCSVMVSIGKPVGTGTLVVRSAHPLAAPEIRSGLLDHPDDRAQAVAALTLARELADRPAMRAVARPLLPVPWVLRDARRLDGAIRRWSDSGYHPCGTAPMGPEGSPDAVCDARGRVHGVANLYVADASLFPTIPSVNIHLPTLMVAERIAGFLAEEPPGLTSSSSGGAG